MATINVAIASVQCKTVRRIVNYSSMARYGKGHQYDDLTVEGPPFQEHFRPNPCDVYGVAKVAAERSLEILCDLHDIAWVHCIPHNVYGEANARALSDPYRGVLLIWINSLLRNKSFYIYGDGKQQRAPSYVGDCVGPMSLLGFQDNVVRQCINIGSLKHYTMNELATITCQVFEKVTKRTAPKPIYTAPRPCEVKDAWCSIEKSVKLVNYNDKTSIEQGLEKVITWAMSIAPQGLEPRYLQNLEIESSKVPVTWKDKLI